MLIIMNSANKYFNNLIDELIRLSEVSGAKKLIVKQHFVKVTSYKLDVSSVSMEDVSLFTILL